MAAKDSIIMPTRTRKTLMQRFTAICERHGWQCGRVRVLCDVAQSPRNTAQTCARYNAVAIWRGARVEQLGLIVEVKEWSDEQIAAKLKELEDKDATSKQTMC